MSPSTPARRDDARAAKHAESAKERARKKKASAATLAAGPVMRAVDRGRLAAILAGHGIDLDHETERLDLPASLDGLEILSTPPLKHPATVAVHLVGRRVQPQEEENAALRSIAAAGESVGEEELWGVLTKNGVRHFWASVSAVQAHYPDLYTRERRAQAVISPVSGVSQPLQIQRYGLQRR